MNQAQNGVILQGRPVLAAETGPPGRFLQRLAAGVLEGASQGFKGLTRARVRVFVGVSCAFQTPNLTYYCSQYFKRLLRCHGVLLLSPAPTRLATG